MAEKIQLKHPDGKHMPCIDAEKYEKIKKAMFSVLKNAELSHTELLSKLNRRLKGKFEGNVSWYAECVKLDLESRKIIKRTEKKPQTYFISNHNSAT